MNQNKINTSLLSSLIQYIKKPDYNIAFKKGLFKNKLGDIIKYWSLGVVVSFLSVMASAIFLNNIGVDDSQNVLQDFFDNGSIFIIILVVFFIGPITEELTFRLGLRFSPFRFGFSLVFIFFLLFELLLAVNLHLASMLEGIISRFGYIYFLILLLFLIIILGFLFSYIASISVISKKVDRFYKKYFSVIFYSVTILFGVIHFFNFANFKDLWFVLPFLVAPQIFLGFILAYIRMAYGFAWSIFYHFFHNALAALPILLFAKISDESMKTIIAGNEDDIMNIAMSDKLLLISSSGIGLIIFIMVLIFFTLLIKNHRDYLKIKNPIK